MRKQRPADYTSVEVDAVVIVRGVITVSAFLRFLPIAMSALKFGANPHIVSGSRMIGMRTSD